jgi:hypothetical protein
MPAVPDGLQMLPEYVGAGGATATNVLNFIKLGDDPSNAELDDIASGWQSVFLSYASNQWALNGGTRFVFIDEDPAPDYEAANTGDVGTTSGAVLPAQCSICVSIIASAGRRGRGRIYLPGISEGSVLDTSHIVSTVLDDIQEALTDWIQEVLQPLSVALAVYSRLDGVVRPLNQAGIDSVIDTQRRLVARLDV